MAMIDDDQPAEIARPLRYRDQTISRRLDRRSSYRTDIYTGVKGAMPGERIAAMPEAADQAAINRPQARKHIGLKERGGAARTPIASAAAHSPIRHGCCDWAHTFAAVGRIKAAWRGASRHAAPVPATIAIRAGSWHSCAQTARKSRRLQ